MIQLRLDDVERVHAASAGDPGSGGALVQRVANTMWPVCRRLTRGEAEAREARSEMLAQISADNFLMLRGYAGRVRLETSLGLICREILAQRLLRLLQDDGAAAWGAFEAMFQSDIDRLIQRRLPGMNREELRPEAYQEIRVALIAEDCRRLRAYRGGGAFGGFVLHMVDRLLIDDIRTVSGRRRIRAGHRGNSSTAVASGAARFVPIQDWSETAGSLGAEAADPASPEDALIASGSDRLLAQAGEILRDSGQSLPEEGRLYPNVALGAADPRPVREIAKRMGRPVADVYRVREQLKRSLHEALHPHPAVQKWQAGEACT